MIQGLFCNLSSGDAGSGKSSAMAKMCLDWAQEENTQDCEEKTTTGLERFEFTFLIQLKDVNSDISLEEVIIRQHNLDVKPSAIKFILQNTNSLIVLDGYDEYTKSTNHHIDEIVSGERESGFVLITTRSRDYMTKQDHDQMDGEVQFRGLSDESVIKYAQRYLDSKEKLNILIVKANEAEIHELLRIPIVLLLVCVVFLEEESLPKTKTDIVWKIIKMFRKRAAAKGHQIDDKVLFFLAELSWLALQKETQQLLINQVGLKIKYLMVKLFQLSERITRFKWARITTKC